MRRPLALLLVAQLPWLLGCAGERRAVAPPARGDGSLPRSAPVRSAATGARRSTTVASASTPLAPSDAVEASTTASADTAAPTDAALAREDEPTRRAASTASPSPAATPSPTLALQRARRNRPDDSQPPTRGRPASSRPVRLTLASIGVDARVLLPLHVASDGALEVPNDPDSVGWWRSTVTEGPVVLVGHVDSRSGPAVFARLPSLDLGDTVTLDYLGEAAPRRFVVSRLLKVSKQRFPTDEVYGGGRDELRLITCGGQFDRRTGHYVDNIVVFASAVA